MELENQNKSEEIKGQKEANLKTIEKEKDIKFAELENQRKIIDIMKFNEEQNLTHAIDMFGLSQSDSKPQNENNQSNNNSKVNNQSNNNQIPMNQNIYNQPIPICNNMPINQQMNANI